MSRAKPGLALLALVQLTCHQAPLTAPPGSTITVFANPEFIPADGGVSVISALVIEPAGTPVADGTVVQFFTNLGRIDEQGRTNDGVARVNLVSDSRSGAACVSAFSGGPATGGGGTSTTTTTSGTTLASLTAATVVAAASQACDATVNIGSALPASVLVTAFPPRLREKRATLITANVFDERGNPVSNVPVIFRVEADTGDTLTEFMESQGTPTFTNNNGQSQDVMRTRYNPENNPKTVTVTATTANKIEGTVVVTIN